MPLTVLIGVAGSSVGVNDSPCGVPAVGGSVWAAFRAREMKITGAWGPENDAHKIIIPHVLWSVIRQRSQTSDGNSEYALERRFESFILIVLT